VIHGLPVAAAQATSQTTGGNGDGTADTEADDDEVIDAEFTRE
jgi:hypothetical protein